jgi:putative nucleotidyltransferase with HDIG domain
MGRTKKYAETIRVIGYIHDIGKMVIPSEILSKSGKLTDAEMGLIREHPKNGYEMLSKANLPILIAQTAMQHHERLNGSGYPNGMVGEDILSEAKYIAVSDVVESMMSHRPYRPALGLDAALEEIEQGKGVLYDPEIVEACVELFRKDHYELDDRQKEVYFNYEV